MPKLASCSRGAPRVRPVCVAIGLTVASGPPGARFMIGIPTCPQKEEYGPITATRSSACAKAEAFAAHLRNSKPPVWGVETSQDW